MPHTIKFSKMMYYNYKSFEKNPASIKKQRLSCVTTSTVLALAFLPFNSCHAFECILYIYSHPHSILHRTHRLSRLSLLSLHLPHGNHSSYTLSLISCLLMRVREDCGKVGGWEDLTCRCFPVSTKTSPQVDNAHTNGCEVTGQE